MDDRDLIVDWKIVLSLVKNLIFPIRLQSRDGARIIALLPNSSTKLLYDMASKLFPDYKIKCLKAGIPAKIIPFLDDSKVSNFVSKQEIIRVEFFKKPQDLTKMQTINSNSVQQYRDLAFDHNRLSKDIFKQKQEDYKKTKKTHSELKKKLEEEKQQHQLCKDFLKKEQENHEKTKRSHSELKKKLGEEKRQQENHKQTKKATNLELTNLKKENKEFSATVIQLTMDQNVATENFKQRQDQMAKDKKGFEETLKQRLTEIEKLQKQNEELKTSTTNCMSKIQELNSQKTDAAKKFEEERKILAEAMVKHEEERVRYLKENNQLTVQSSDDKNHLEFQKREYKKLFRINESDKKEICQLQNQLKEKRKEKAELSKNLKETSKLLDLAKKYAKTLNILGYEKAFESSSIDFKEEYLVAFATAFLKKYNRYEGGKVKAPWPLPICGEIGIDNMQEEREYVVKMATNPVLFRTLITHIMLKMNGFDDFVSVLKFLDAYVFSLHHYTEATKAVTKKWNNIGTSDQLIKAVSQHLLQQEQDITTTIVNTAAIHTADNITAVATAATEHASISSAATSTATTTTAAAINTGEDCSDVENERYKISPNDDEEGKEDSPSVPSNIDDNINALIETELRAKFSRSDFDFDKETPKKIRYYVCQQFHVDPSTLTRDQK